MKKQIIFAAFLVIISVKSFSQIVFEDGYFINESNQKINCLIKNTDSKNNPTEFNYKILPDGEIKEADIKNIKEFGITGFSKYIRAKVNMDRSSNEINNLSSHRNPIFQEETLFLKVIIEGKVSFYHYEERNLTRFFYSINDSEITQLIFKQYLLNDKIATNNYFKQQLLNDFGSQGISLQDIKYIGYNKKDLKRFVIKINESLNSDYSIQESKQKQIYLTFL